MEETKARNGKVLKKLSLVYKKTILDEMLDYLKLKLRHFVKHNFVVQWEDKQFKAYLKSFPKDNIVSVVDFTENYFFKIQNEVQNMHWHSYQINILVHICFCHNLHFDPYNEKTSIFNEYYFYISNDHKHDSEFVQHCFKIHW